MSNQFLEQFSSLKSVNSCLQKRDEISNSELFTNLKMQLSKADIEGKKELGKKLNELKQELQIACDSRIQEIQAEQTKDNFTHFDPTFYSKKYKQSPGQFHPVTMAIKEILDIFAQMGFDVADGPLVTTQDKNFTVLNMPDYHPARSMQDTFFLKEKDQNGENYVLRTHTTAEDFAYATNHQPPFKVVIPGQVYRNEAIDLTHDIIFHQIECLIIKEKGSLAELKTLIGEFYNRFFDTRNIQTRFRPSYFPYTVPSLEVDISNPFYGKAGHRLEHKVWIEAGGAGLLHPQVLRNMNLDPKKWQGLAFGFGIDRMIQLKLGLSRLGQFFEGKISFLKGID